MNATCIGVTLPFPKILSGFLDLFCFPIIGKCDFVKTNETENAEWMRIQEGDGGEDCEEIEIEIQNLEDARRESAGAFEYFGGKKLIKGRGTLFINWEF